MQAWKRKGPRFEFCLCHQLKNFNVKLLFLECGPLSTTLQACYSLRNPQYYSKQTICIEICFESIVLWSGSKYLIYWKWRPGFIWNCKSGNQIVALTCIISCLMFGSSDTHIRLLGAIPGKGINQIVSGECRNWLLELGQYFRSNKGTQDLSGVNPGLKQTNKSGTHLVSDKTNLVLFPPLNTRHSLFSLPQFSSSPAPCLIT